MNLTIFPFLLKLCLSDILSLIEIGTKVLLRVPLVNKSI